MVLGNVASSPLLDSTRSMQLSAISSTPSRTPCGPLLRFGRRITSIERLGGSPLVPRLLRSFHWEYRSKECAELRNLARRDIHIINTNLTSRGKKLLKLLISKTRLIKIFEVYRDKIPKEKTESPSCLQPCAKDFSPRKNWSGSQRSVFTNTRYHVSGLKVGVPT